MIRTHAARPGRTWLSGLLGLAGGALLGVTGTVLLLPYFDSGKPGDKANAAGGNPDREVYAYGHLEPAGGLVAVFGSPGDRIVEFAEGADQVGTRVAKGDPLVTMASDVLRAKEIEIAERRHTDAVGQREAVEKVARAKRLEVEQEISNAERKQEVELSGQLSKLDVARREVREASDQYDRLRSLTQGTVSGSDLRQKELQVSRARAELKAGEEAYEAARKALDDGKVLADVKRKAADAEMDSKVKAVPVEAAKLAWDAAIEKERTGRVVAPVGGTVVRVQGVPGETTSQVKPILLLAADGKPEEGMPPSDGRLIVRAEIPESDVVTVRDLLRKGGSLTASIRCPSIKDPKNPNEVLTLRGEIASANDLARAISRNTVSELAPSAGTDRRVVEAVIQVTVAENDKASLDLARSVLGLQVDVTLNPQRKKAP